ncbi:MAG: helix-turn-helix transcriptional regulator [Thauera sp.]|nr:helix-turn-helix transcriptional regulator [Thauera sp.]
MDEQGVTKNELARKIWGEIKTQKGYLEPKNRTTLARYLNGSVVPRDGTIRAMAKELNVSFHDLKPSSDPLERPGSGVTMEMVDLKNVRLTVNVVVPRALARQIVEQLTPYAA